MTDAHILGPDEPGPRPSGDAKYSGPNSSDPVSKSFPWERVFFTVAFAFVAWFVFWVALFLALATAVIRLTNVKLEADIGGYTGRAVRYLRDILSYIAGLKDEKPFPFSPLTKDDTN